jgi:hypothetical protein
MVFARARGGERRMWHLSRPHERRPAGLFRPGMRLLFPVQTAQRPWPDAGGMQALFYLQEIDQEVWEAILVVELERGLHPSNGWDLSAELDKACACVERIDGERAAEAERLSQLVMHSGVLVDLGMMPIQDIPQIPKWA